MGWMDKYEDGGFLGTTNKGFNYNGAWGGPAQNGRVIKKESLEKLTPEQQAAVKADTSFNTDWMSRRKNTFDSEGHPIPVEKGLYNTVKPFDPRILPVKEGTTAGFNPRTGITSLQENFPNISGTVTHEDIHQYDESLPMNKYMKYVGNPAIESMKLDTLLKVDDNNPYLKYMRDPQEVHSYIQELRQHNQLDPTKPVTKEMMDSLKYNDSNLIDDYYDKEEIRGMLNSMVMRNNRTIPTAQNGMVIDDEMGQWAHPGKITRINSNHITMKGVGYPVLGVSDTGDKKVMKPGKNYNFKGSKVTEYPMIKNGGELTKLDQLTNFTNYNKPQPGGWLDNL